MEDGEEEELSSSSSSSSSDDEVDIDENEIKFRQLQRNARNKASKTRGKLVGLKSYDQLLQEHALTRMKEGLKTILEMHTPVELSSICGLLKLKVQQPAKVSMRLILDYAAEGGKMTEEKIHQIFNCMWEGALVEYLRSIGHPCHSLVTDPKISVMAIWQKGGLMGSRSFTPHFIAREVKKRYDWKMGDDVLNRIDALRIAQENAKKAEKLVIQEHNYQRILGYFHEMANLRKQETEVRDYLAGELTIARSRLKSQDETAKMSSENLAELENKVIDICEYLNRQLAHYESMAEAEQKKNIRNEIDIQRIYEIVESYVQVLDDRNNEVLTKMPLKLYKEDDSSPEIKKFNNKLEEFFSFAEKRDEELRNTIKGLIEENNNLTKKCHQLENAYHEAHKIEAHAVMQVQTLKDVIHILTKRNVAYELKEQFGGGESMGVAIRYAAKVHEINNQYKALKPTLLNGVQSSNFLVVMLCQQIIKVLELDKHEDVNRVLETIIMQREDAAAARIRKGAAGKKTIKGKNAAKGKSDTASVASSTTSKKTAGDESKKKKKKNEDETSLKEGGDGEDGEKKKKKKKKDGEESEKKPKKEKGDKAEGEKKKKKKG